MTGRPYCFLSLNPVVGSARGATREMSEPKHESTRNLLAEIEGDWDSPRPGHLPTRRAALRRDELHAALDAAADRLVDSLDPPPVSVRNVEELDSGWGDTDEDDDDEEEDDEANEPELPDERLDPVAYAEAKKARDERIEARRERRRAKAEAKKARRKARAEAQKSKQKGKQRRRKRPPQKARASGAFGQAARRARAQATTTRERDDSGDEDVAPTPAPCASRAKAQLASSSATKPMLSKTNQWMLAVAVIVFIAAAIFAAVVAR